MKVKALSSDSTMRNRERVRPIGAILVDQGRLNPKDLERIVKFARGRGIRFGDAAVELKLVTHVDVDAALALQFKYPVLERGERGVADDVIAGHDPTNALVEPIRALRTELMLRWTHASSRKVLAINSPDRGDGRSWLAANLAVAFAQTRARTLLIDANLRQPSQHHLFRLQDTLGLSGLLTGRAGSSTLHRVHPRLHLYVLPAGSKPPNPQELLASRAFEFVIDRFAKQFDTVLIDTPAASGSADAQLIASKAGSAILVGRRNKSRFAKLNALMKGLQVTGTKVIGCVLNEY